MQKIFKKEMKFCVKCKNNKNEGGFYKHSASSDGLNSWCKECNLKATKQTAQKYKERNLLLSKNEIVLVAIKKKCYSCQKTKLPKHFYVSVHTKDGLSKKCIKCVALCGKNFRDKNPNYAAQYNKKYYQKNMGRLRLSIKQYVKDNPEKIDIARRIRDKKNYPKLRFKKLLSDRLRKALKRGGASKTRRTHILIGCSIQELRDFLESKFTTGMSWENYGEWHIDHKKPCAAFDLSDENQQLQCFHYSNLQPLWAKDNRGKDSFYEGKRHYYKKHDS